MRRNENVVMEKMKCIRFIGDAFLAGLVIPGIRTARAILQEKDLSESYGDSGNDLILFRPTNTIGYTLRSAALKTIPVLYCCPHLFAKSLLISVD